MEPYAFRALLFIAPETRIRKRMYTAKLVKRLLIASNSSIEHVFTPVRGPEPKLVHISQLLRIDGGKVHPANYTDRLSPGAYVFYLGGIDGAASRYAIDSDAAYKILVNIGGNYGFAGVRIRAEILGIENIHVNHVAEQVVSKMKKEERFKLVLVSPTIFRSPVAGTKYKSYVPSVMNIFSTPVYIRLYLAGKLHRTLFMKTLLRLEKALGVPPTFWQTLRKIDLRYEPGRRVPALIGYVNLHYSRGNDEEGTALEILREILPYMLALGTGVGRAAGLGHIDLQ